MPIKKSYSLLDIGSRTGVGSNLLGEVFSSELWGYQIKFAVDTIDISKDWNTYMKLNPYIRQHSNKDLFSIEKDTYDVCFCSHTIEHLDDPISFVNQMKYVARYFSFVTCPYEEKDPIKGHRTITKEIIDACQPKWRTTYKSVNRWKPDLECVVFTV